MLNPVCYYINVAYHFSVLYDNYSTDYGTLLHLEKIKRMKGKARRKHSLHEKTAASVL